MFLSKSTTAAFLITLFLNVASVIGNTLDEENCKACVAKNCGFCVGPSGQEQCICNLYEFDYGWVCNEPTSKYKTSTAYRCSENNPTLLIGLAIGLATLFVTCICCFTFNCRTKEDERTSEDDLESTRQGRHDPLTSLATLKASKLTPSVATSEEASFNS